MDDSMTKVRLLDYLRTNRQAFDELIASVPKNRMMEPMAVSEWSVKDNIAHMTYYEGWIGDRLLEQLAGIAHIPSGMEGLPWQEVNQRVYEAHKNQPLDEVMQESRTAFARLIQAVEALPEEFLTQPQQLEGIPQPIIIWHILRGDVYEHTLEHIETIQKWLSKITERDL